MPSVWQVFVPNAVIIGKSAHPNLLVGTSYYKEAVDELLQTEPMGEVVQLPTNNVQARVRDLVKRCLDNILDDHKPKKKLALPLTDKVKTSTPRPPTVLFSQPTSMYVKFQPGVLDGDELTFFLQ